MGRTRGCLFGWFWGETGAAEILGGEVRAQARRANVECRSGDRIMSWFRRILPKAEKMPPADNRPLLFGKDSSWLAISGSDTDRALVALDVVVVSRATWKKGLAAAHEDSIFVTPPVKGWIFAVSTLIPGPGVVPGDEDTMTPTISMVSQRLQTIVQCFHTDRAIERHAWAWAASGKVKRSYAYCGHSGTTLVNLGAPSTEELELGFRFFDENSAESKIAGYWERQDLRYPCEQDVLELAGRWSLDPRSLEGMAGPTELGWLVEPRSAEREPRGSGARAT